MADRGALVDDKRKHRIMDDIMKRGSDASRWRWKDTCGRAISCLMVFAAIDKSHKVDDVRSETMTSGNNANDRQDTAGHAHYELKMSQIIGSV